MTTPCTQCERAFPPTQLAAGLCPECRPEAPKVLTPVSIAALVCAAIPFVFHASSSSSVTVNGEVTQAVFRDWIAISVGGVGALVSLAAIAQAMKAKGLQLGMAGVAVALCLFQVARGFGAL